MTTPNVPPKSNDTALAVVLGIVIVLGVIVALGAMVIGRFVGNIHVAESGRGSARTVEIHSPLGNLEVNGSGHNATVDIRSVLGDLHVSPTTDTAALGMAVYPGAEMVQSRADSPFHQGVEMPDGGNWVGGGVSNGGESAHVQLRGGGAELEVNVAEFRTTATPEQVLDFYAGLLDKLGPVKRKQQSDGAVTLEQKLGDTNVRVAAIKPGSDGTHFVLARIMGDSQAK